MKDLLPNPYLLGLGIFLLSYIIIYGIKRLLSTRLENHFKITQNKWDEIVVHTVEQTTQFFIICSSLYIAFQYLPHQKKFNHYVDRGYFIVIMIQVGIWTNCLLDYYIVRAVHRKTRNNKAAANSIGLLKLLAKFILFTIFFLFTLNNLDIKITTMVAGLGVGGIAVALAIQKLLGDLISSLSIVLDKPFVMGDFIIVDQHMGEVEKIGLRTIHLRALGGEQIIIPNSDILAARIRNMKRMHERRVAFVLSLTLEVPPDGIELAVQLITDILKGKEKVKFDRCHLQQISRTSFDIETVYFFVGDDYNFYMDMQQQVLLEIYRALHSNNLFFAYPAQALYHMPLEIQMRRDSPPREAEHSFS